jgi:hypothetical protein
MRRISIVLNLVSTFVLTSVCGMTSAQNVAPQVAVVTSTASTKPDIANDPDVLAAQRTRPQHPRPTPTPTPTTTTGKAPMVVESSRFRVAALACLHSRPTDSESSMSTSVGYQRAVLPNPLAHLELEC